MIVIVGTLIVLGSVVGGFTMAGGNTLALLHLSEMIINVGDCLQRWTNDTLRSANHRVTLPRAEESVEDLVETLMGRKPELRFRFIQENAEFAAEDLDV